ncbi:MULTISPECIES: helicase HerA-like domain-containing protein [Methylomonas]|uniref:ATP-binding protein n=1 Tax=Methylomonas koyamae TaxID=702114 RepID=A0A177NAK4_9GAMM|nr:helicase HerA-like domain-containing protein [Methylomonas koyamae]OAI15076.1 ATP-binding protein [Methylomonas koyamae]
MPTPLLIAKAGTAELNLLPAMANRHGLIAGATGTGKTITLQTLAEAFSDIGVPVFVADVKGDLAGLSRAGGGNPKVETRLADLAIQDRQPAAAPVLFWDVFGVKGHPLRATISDMGPLLLARMLNLNDVQSGVLTAAFKIADDQGWLLLDLKDLKAMLQYVAEHGAKLADDYGKLSAASVGAIQRGLLQLEHEGGEHLFGEPALDFNDLLQTDGSRGVINILAAETLYQSPRVYATLLLWLLSELFENLPEAGDLDQPKLVFFFDEAHLLFNDAPAALLQKIEHVVRLIRSKGVGVYFVSQNPQDIPDVILGQLGNRIQHALRAFTPRDQKAVRAAAETFRANPGLDVATAIGELGVGEALVSLLDEQGTPLPVERALIKPPRSRIGPVSDAERRETLAASIIAGHYEKQIDRESAYEILKQRAGKAEASTVGGGFDWGEVLPGGGQSGSRRRGGQSVLEAAAKSAARSIGQELGRQIIRGVLGSLLGGRR